MTQQVVNLSDTVRLKRTRRRKTDARGEDQMSWSSTETRLLNPFIFTFLYFTVPTPFPKVAQPLIVGSTVTCNIESNKTNTRDSISIKGSTQAHKLCDLYESIDAEEE